MHVWVNVVLRCWCSWCYYYCWWWLYGMFLSVCADLIWLLSLNCKNSFKEHHFLSSVQSKKETAFFSRSLTLFSWFSWKLYRLLSFFFHFFLFCTFLFVACHDAMMIMPPSPSPPLMQYTNTNQTRVHIFYSWSHHQVHYLWRINTFNVDTDVLRKKKDDQKAVVNING